MQTLRSEQLDSLLDSKLFLPLLQCPRHISPKQVRRAPSLPGLEHVVDSVKDHSSDSNDGPLLAPPFGNALIFILLLLTYRRTSKNKAEEKRVKMAHLK